MSLMITFSQWMYDEKHPYLKCKRCKSEFYIKFNSDYSKTVCYCPVCGQPAQPRRKNKAAEDN